VTYPMCGLIMEYTSWTWVFYSTSAITVLWFVAWTFFYFDLPEDDPYISEEEKKYIISTRSFNPAQQEEDLKTPIIPLTWDIIKTPAVWVCMCCDFCNGFGLYVLITEGPDFIANILPIGKNISNNGWLSAAPYLARTIFAQIIGASADFLIAKNYVPRMRMQKINTALAFIIPAAGMICMSYLTSENTQYLCIAVLTISFGFNGGTMSGYILNMVGLAPNRSGTAYGVSNGFGNISGFLVPLVKTWIVADVKRIEDWRNLFFVAAACYTFAALIFSLFASRNVQNFNSKNYQDSSTLEYVKTSCFSFKHLRK